mgnify:CR=1 FL=1
MDEPRYAGWMKARSVQALANADRVGRIGAIHFEGVSDERAALLARFRAAASTERGAVLVASASFWEGVDLAGDALQLLVIDKLPFATPDDPVYEARLDAIRTQGGNPFRDEQLPQAVIALKQGVGRLIRSETDRGVLVLCDPRLLNRGYGKVFLQSLPPFRRTRALADVQAFFAPQWAPVADAAAPTAAVAGPEPAPGATFPLF